MTRIKACEKLLDNGGERIALKAKKMIHHQKLKNPLEDLWLGYSGEMKNHSFVHQKQGSVMKGKA